MVPSSTIEPKKKMEFITQSSFIMRDNSRETVFTGTVVKVDRIISSMVSTPTIKRLMVCLHGMKDLMYMSIGVHLSIICFMEKEHCHSRMVLIEENSLQGRNMGTVFTNLITG